MALGQEPLEIKPEQPDAKSEDPDTDRDEDVRHAEARLEGGPLQEGQARRREGLGLLFPNEVAGIRDNHGRHSFEIRLPA